jgi:hypothetical protein
MTDECEAPGTPPQQVCGYLRVCVCVYGVCAGIWVGVSGDGVGF